MPTITANENADQYLSTNYNEKQYHPTPEQLKVRKARHRRSGSQGSGNCNQMQGGSPRISPLRERKVCNSLKESLSKCLQFLYLTSIAELFIIITFYSLQISLPTAPRQSRILDETRYSKNGTNDVPEEDEVDTGDCFAEKESKSLNIIEISEPRDKYPHLAASTGTTPRLQHQDFDNLAKRDSMDKHNGLIYTEKPTLFNELLPDRIENRDNMPDPELSANLTNNFNSRQYFSSSDDSSDDDCRIIPIEKDDYLETLDRKVTEVISQSRISNGGIVASTSTELNRKASIARRQNHRTKPSPASSKRSYMKTPSSSDNQGNLESSPSGFLDENLNNGNTILNTNNEEGQTRYLPRIARFDESNRNNNQDASSDTQESSQERWSDGEEAGSEEGGNFDDRDIIRRRR